MIVSILFLRIHQVFDFGRFAIISMHFNRPLVVQLDVICDDVARAQLFAVHDVGAAT